ncbi:hypothetical protein F542_3700 [Bibersteinia trehalosi USDA-ARS-USMARC-188]|uniref:Uncharacterized protein n=3 Tax=Bibersteinia trehalosi TaxID=47735 RepID=W0R8I0_BIBTR|nr:hypothetical protein WQG_18880 [Bibersteinia trehalosi USDA-ARS-USMARC-192]AHG81088.1 hypothetical protein F542_3700 [Bibersteinia trehalosi USDA-ARS-USMARC-188]AHG83299.1 hypothetical protein F543_4350 [Bibersteinia trehalosi USDA-ARS-USMARC-189]AHG87096.1 hypothetical protein F544_18680 [Bibersteinia trehalosi USDA-ARS-USMARC-190]
MILMFNATYNVLNCDLLHILQKNSKNLPLVSDDTLNMDN